ncbi:MAG: DUF1080 domain-containing protein [Calditrichota bacterium]
MNGSPRLKFFLILLSGVIFLWNCSTAPRQSTLVTGSNQDIQAVLGRWDVTVYDPVTGAYPSWFEITGTPQTLGGQFVGRVGSARPIRYAHYDGKDLVLSLSPQYENQVQDLLLAGTVSGNRIDGTTFSESGQRIRFSASRAPALTRQASPQGGEPVDLIGENFSGWRARYRDRKNGWAVNDGVLVNTPPSVDIVSRRTFNDFKLHAEFKFPKGSNSGIYLRGRYEMQVQDDYGNEPESHECGGIYGFIAPRVIAVNPPGEWNSVDITLIGRRVTIEMNGKSLMENAEIPGITGGALNSREGEPGPIMLQGDHGTVQYRNVVVTPAR